MKHGILATLVLLLITDQRAFGSFLTSASPKIQPFSEQFLARLLLATPPTPRDKWQTLKNCNSVGELARRVRELNLPLVGQEFTAALARDVFMNDKAGHSQISAYANSSIPQIVEILRKGILSFQREVAVSPSYPWNVGYDVVGYRIIQEDESVSYVLAYRQDQPNAETQRDTRPRINLVLVAQQNYSLVRSVKVKGSNTVEKKVIPRKQAEEEVVHLLSF